MYEEQGSNPSSLQKIGKEQEGETEERREKREERGGKGKKGRKGGKGRGKDGRELDQQTEGLMCPCKLAAYNMFLHNVDYKQQFEQI